MLGFIPQISPFWPKSCLLRLKGNIWPIEKISIMQFLQEIIRLSYFHFYPEVEYFSPPEAKNERLYRAIRDGEVSTNEEARQLIYGDRSATKKYTMLKQRLKIQVINRYYELLSQTDSEELLPVLKHRLDYLKNLTIVHTLIRRGRYALAQQFLNHHQRAAEAQFDLLAVQEGLQLQHQLASYQGSRRPARIITPNCKPRVGRPRPCGWPAVTTTRCV